MFCNLCFLVPRVSGQVHCCAVKTITVSSHLESPCAIVIPNIDSDFAGLSISYKVQLHLWKKNARVEYTFIPNCITESFKPCLINK